MVAEGSSCFAWCPFRVWPPCGSRRPSRAPTVQLSCGKVSGVLQPGTIAHFSGIPFATPPVGPRRWLRPLPPSGWKGTLDCNPEAAKRGGRRAWPIQEIGDEMHDNGMSEDCLYLDVWAPAAGLGGDINKSAVMLWIYGGGFTGGSKDYDNNEQRALAERGVVCICANYRLGVLGFLQPEGGDANCAVWDMVEALRWIQREIAAFGGDPGRVTVMGQSAGACMTYFLASSRLANKLFHRAILHSPASFMTTQEQGRELAEEFAAVAGAASSRLADLQALDADTVFQTQQKGRFRLNPTITPGWRVMCALGGKLVPLQAPDPSPAGMFRFAPGTEPEGYQFLTAIIDGELFEEQPLEALFHKVAAHLDVIVGGNREEDAVEPSEKVEPIEWTYGVELSEGEGYQAVVQRMAWEIVGMPTILRASSEHVLRLVDEVAQRYEKERMLDIYGLGPCGRAGSKEQWLHDTMMTDFSFLAKAYLIAERLAEPGACRRVFRYQFNGYDDRGDGFHAAELCLLFGEDGQKMLKLPGALEVRRQWIDSWAAFVRTGDPNTAEMAGAWRPCTKASSPVLFWDGVRGWDAEGGSKMARRAGLLALARLYERLWNVTPASTGQ